MSRQPTDVECECGTLVPVTQLSDYEFDVRCPRCHHYSTVSWAHSAPPPDFDEPGSRFPLFDDFDPRHWQ